MTDIFFAPRNAATQASPSVTRYADPARRKINHVSKSVEKSRRQERPSINNPTVVSEQGV